MPWSSQSCNDRRYSYFTRNICSRSIDSLKSSLEQRRKHVLRLLQLYGDQAQDWKLKTTGLLVRRISARFQYNGAKSGKSLKIGTKEADTT